METYNLANVCVQTNCRNNYFSATPVDVLPDGLVSFFRDMPLAINPSRNLSGIHPKHK